MSLKRNQAEATGNTWLCFLCVTDLKTERRTEREEECEETTVCRGSERKKQRDRRVSSVCVCVCVCVRVCVCVPPGER